jgi:beta-phosphoglucomutase-like phosphatase (HAD superfamily)
MEHAVHGSHRFQGAIFDVDGVLVDSPHYRAWRDALQELMGTEWTDVRGRTSYAPEKFTEAVYQQVVAGRPRLAGARAALEYFGVPDAGRRAELFAAVKQEHLVTLIEAGEFTAFADAIRFVLATKAAGISIAAASSSKNADLLCGRRGSIPMSPSRTSPCLTCWTRTSPGATCRGASPIR